VDFVIAEINFIFFPIITRGVSMGRWMSLSISQPQTPDYSLALYKTLHEMKTEAFGTVRLNRIGSSKK
jgi:hypothetical protein